MKYKKGDKVVLKIRCVDEKDIHRPYLAGIRYGAWFSEDNILGKLSDYTKSERIKFSEAEKKEFDDIRMRTKELLNALMVITKSCTHYPHLKKWILEKDYPLPRNEREILFAKVWENPELIEVVKEKKYRLLIMPVTLDYLSFKNNMYTLSSKTDASIFTENQLRQLGNSGFLYNINVEKCKEEIK